MSHAEARRCPSCGRNKLREVQDFGYRRRCRCVCGHEVLRVRRAVWLNQPGDSYEDEDEKAAAAEIARMTAQQAAPPANPTPQGPLTCESCGASDVYRCGCYDRCRCDHDRRSHTPHGICTHVGCACTHGLHGRGTWATPPASPEPPVITGDTSDGYHTFNELYAYRKAYHALVVNEWARQGRYDVHKSWRHADGESCFGGGWFIVVAETPAGQVSNHYEADDWPLFQCPERERGAPWDGHTPQVALDRLLALAASPVPVPPTEERIGQWLSAM